MPSEFDAPESERLIAEIGGLDRLDERSVSVRFESDDGRSWQMIQVSPAPDVLLCRFSRELVPPPADRGAVVVDLAQSGHEPVAKLNVRVWGHSGEEWARLEGPGGVIVTYRSGQSIRQLRYTFALP